MRISNPKNMKGDKLLTNIVASGMITGEGTEESPIEFVGISAVDSAGSSVIPSISGIKAGNGITISSGANGIAVLGAEATATGTVTIDSALSSSSENPVQNKAVFNALEGKASSVHAHPISDVTGLQNALDGKQPSGNYAVLTGGKVAENALPDLSGTYVATSAANVASGYVKLDGNGKVPTAVLPSYVSDVFEGYLVSGKFRKTNSDSGTEIEAKSNAIYVDLETNKTYRWSGSQYTEISASVALGRTAQTAFPGDAGSALETSVANLVDGKADASELNSYATTEAMNTALAGKANSSHTHTKSQITDFSHTHAISDVTGLQSALDGKQAALPSGTAGQYLQKTASGVQWADAATGGDYLMTDNLANAALNAPIFFLSHSSASVPGPVEWGLCNRQYFLYSGEDAVDGITDTGKLEQGHTYVHSMLGDATFQPLTGNVWTVTRSDPEAPDKAYANPGTWYEQYYFATSNESTLISVQVRYTEAYSWADIKYNDVTERYKLTRNGTNSYYETNVVPAGEIVRATGTVNHYGDAGYNNLELVMSALPDTATHPPYYNQSHWTGRIWNGSNWESVMTEPLLQNDSWISLESAVAEIGGEIVATGSQDGGYEFIRTERHAGEVIDAMYIDITPASNNSTTPTTEGVVTVDSGSSASTISVAVVNEFPANPQSGVLYFVPVTAIQNLDTSNGISASIVTSLPSSPDADTLYFVTGSN